MTTKSTPQKGARKSRAPQTKSERAARCVLDFLNSADTPEFIHTALMVTVIEAASATPGFTFDFPSDEIGPAGYREELDSLERLFRLLPPLYNIPVHNSPEALARDLAAAMANPSMPRAIYEAIYEAMNSEFQPVCEEVDRSAGVILSHLKALARKGGEGE